tara:strand:+ start:337 stop:558 length:222 start_codon:yes stop_codon:yes gene_type:complete
MEDTMPRIRELDLHGIKHEDVDRLVENFVLLNTLPLRIITGNSNKMRELVVDVLNRHSIEYEQFKPSHITVLK